MAILIVLFGILCTFLYYVYYKYNRSRNKPLFFKTTVYRSLLWALGILLATPILVNFLFPDTQLKLDSAQAAHSGKSNLIGLLKHGDLFGYYKEIFQIIWLNINIAGFVSAVLILITWFIFINRIDFFNKEKPKFPVLALVLGMLFSVLTFLISDALNLAFPLQLQGSFLHDLFISSFVGIGIIEEFVKLIPFFIILLFTKEIDEPFDYILYACMTSLGFAFIENLGYFRELGGSIIQGRAFMSVVGHMIFSSFCVYGLVLAKYNYKKAWPLYFLASFLIGSFCHGFYDYLIFSHSPILFFLFFIFILQVWTIIINNAVNNSNFFDFKITFQMQKLRFFLAVMLASILALSYFINAIQFGKDVANEGFIVTCLFGGFFMIFYVTSLSNYDLVKGYWRPIKLQFSSPNSNQLPGNRAAGSLLSVFKYNYILPVNLVHYQITIRPPHYNNLLFGIMEEVKGEITDRICLFFEDPKTGKEIIETDWFLVTLQQCLNIQHHLDNVCIDTHVLIKLEDNTDSLLHDEDIRCFIRLIPNLNALQKAKPLKTDFAFGGFVLLNSHDVPAYA